MPDRNMNQGERGPRKSGEQRQDQQRNPGRQQEQQGDRSRQQGEKGGNEDRSRSDY